MALLDRCPGGGCCLAAGGIGVGIILPSRAALLRSLLDGCLVVTDDEIRAAMRTLALDAKVVAEPAGAAAFAAWTGNHASLQPPVAVVVSVGKGEPGLLAQLLRERRNP